VTFLIQVTAWAGLNIVCQFCIFFEINVLNIVIQDFSLHSKNDSDV